MNCKRNKISICYLSNIFDNLSPHSFDRINDMNITDNEPRIQPAMLLLLQHSIQLKCGIEYSQTCDEQYKLFLNCYSKQFNEENKQTFCQNVQKLQLLDQQSNDITNLMDINLNQLLNFKQKPKFVSKDDANASIFSKLINKIKLSQADCQQYACYADNPLQDLQKMNDSVNLQQSHVVTQSKDQQQCGSCWAFGTVAVLENSIMNDKQNLQPFWQQFDQSTLNISEQFILSNTYGYSWYCDGGDFVMAVQYIHDNYQSVETAQNYPYDYQKYEQLHYNYQLLPNKLQKEDFLLPFKTYKSVQGPQTPVVGIHVDEQQKFSQQTINTIKSYLNRGIAIAAAMYVGDSQLQFYNGSTYIEKQCPTFKADHQVTIIGYKKMNKKEVWIVKNSWGQDWGKQGSFYVPIGNDDFCIERYAYTVIPKYYDGGSKATPSEISGPLIGMITFSCIVALAVLCGCVYLIVQCYKKKKREKRVYYVLNES